MQLLLILSYRAEHSPNNQVKCDFTDRWDNSLKIIPLGSGEDRSSPTSLDPGPGPFTTLLHELLLPLVSRVLTLRNPLQCNNSNLEE